MAAIAQLPQVAPPGINTRADSTVMDSLLDTLRVAINATDSRVDVLDTSAPVNPKNYGAIGDGALHPLSSVYPTLVAAQVVYPFATSLTQSIDYCAFRKAAGICWGEPAAEHGYTNRRLNRPMYIPAGIYHFGNDVLTTRDMVGVQVIGAGRLSVEIRATGKVWAIDGLWYSKFSGMSIISESNTAVCCFDIDGNVPGHPYATRGVQQNTFEDMLFDGGGSLYSSAICRLGGSGGQGSENTFINCFWQNASNSPYYQTGFNALANTIIGGNIQNYPKHGIQLNAGQVVVINTGFQSTYGYTQITNGGFDIDASSAGAGEHIVVMGCRTESLRFYQGGFSQLANLIGIHGMASIPSVWPGAAQALALNYVMYRTSVAGRARMYRVTTAGNTGGAEPAWADSGTVNDGTVVWTVTNFDFVNVSAGVVDRRSVTTVVGSIVAPDVLSKEINADYIVKPDEEFVMVDTSGGNRVVGLPTNPEDTGIGRLITIKKMTTDANTIQINLVEGASYVIPGGSRGSVTVRWGGGGFVGTGWYKVGST